MSSESRDTNKVTIDLSGKVALITGASRGIGRAAAARMHAAGAAVVVNYHRSEKDARELVAELGEERAQAIAADIGNPVAVETLIDRSLKRFGRIDILVNNAATFDINPFDSDDY